LASAASVFFSVLAVMKETAMVRFEPVLNVKFFRSLDVLSRRRVTCISIKDHFVPRSKHTVPQL
jgi:hypothetical protein